MSNPDLVIRGGTIADGGGGELFEADARRLASGGRAQGRGVADVAG